MKYEVSTGRHCPYWHLCLRFCCRPRAVWSLLGLAVRWWDFLFRANYLQRCRMVHTNADPFGCCVPALWVQPNYLVPGKRANRAYKPVALRGSCLVVCRLPAR